MSLKKNLSWDFNNPHILKFKVNKNDIDILGHVNNRGAKKNYFKVNKKK